MEDELSEGTRVNLRKTVDPAIYGDFACVGNEGWIVKRRKDHLDMNEVYVKWDRNHWTYNGVPDGWTFEEHFEPTKEKKVKKKSKDKQAKQEQIQQAMQKLVESITGDEYEAEFGEDDVVDSTHLLKQNLPQSPDEIEAELDEIDAALEAKYDEAVSLVHKALLDAEGFVIIGVNREDHPKAPDGILVPFTLGFSKSPEGEFLVSAHMSAVAASAHQELALSAISAVTNDDEE